VQCAGRNREKSSIQTMRRAGSSPKTGQGITEKHKCKYSLSQKTQLKKEQAKAF